MRIIPKYQEPYEKITLRDGTEIKVKPTPLLKQGKAPEYRDKSGRLIDKATYDKLLESDKLVEQAKKDARASAITSYGLPHQNENAENIGVNTQAASAIGVLGGNIVTRSMPWLSPVKWMNAVEGGIVPGVIGYPGFAATLGADMYGIKQGSESVKQGVKEASEGKYGDAALSLASGAIDIVGNDIVGPTLAAGKLLSLSSIKNMDDVERVMKELKPRVIKGTATFDENLLFFKLRDIKAGKATLSATKAAKKASEPMTATRLTNYTAKLNVTSKSGVLFDPLTWFSGGDRTAVNGVLPFLQADVNKWMKHVKDEYLLLADDLVALGKLVKRDGKWYGDFNGEMKPLQYALDYVVANSKAYKEAVKRGMAEWDGTIWRSGMSPENAQNLRKTGFTGGAPAWLNDNFLVGLHYKDYSLATGNKRPISGAMIGLIPVGFTKGFDIKLKPNPGSTSNNWFLGKPVGSFLNKEGKATKFVDYFDDASKQVGTTIVYPPDTRFKAFRGNNGDFDLDNFDIFAQNNDKRGQSFEQLA